jgi:hypothetical protein
VELSWSHSLQHSSRHYLHIIASKGKLSITETYKQDNKITHGSNVEITLHCRLLSQQFHAKRKPCIEQLLQWWNHHRRVETERERTVPSNLTARRWRFAVPKLPITEKVQEAECPSWSKPIVASYQGPFSICSPKTANSWGLFTAWSIAFLHTDTSFNTSQTS